MLSVAVAVPASAAPGDLAWKARIKSEDSDVSSSAALAISHDGATVFLAGTVQSLTDGQDWVTAAYDPVTGTRRWLQRFDGVAHDMDQVVDIAVSGDDTTVFVTGGTSRTHSLSNIMTIAYSAETGQPLWKSRHATTSSAYPSSMTILGGRIFIAGEGGEAILIALSARTGDELWMRTGPDDPGSSFLTVAATSGTVVAGGTVIDPARHGDAWVAAFDARTGNRRWSRVYRGPSGGSDNAYDLTIAPDGSTVYVTGFTERDTEDRVVTTAYAVADGTRLWLRTTGPKTGGNDYARAITVAPDGSAVFVAVESFDSSWRPAYKTVAYSSDGDKVWASPVREDDVFNEHGSPADVDVSPDGSTVYVTGAGYPGLSPEGSLTYAYDATVGGPAVWYAYDEPPTSAQADEVAVAPDGSRIFVAGTIVFDARIEAFTTT